MEREPEIEEVTFTTPDGRVVRYSRYLNATRTAWIRHGRFIETSAAGVTLSEGEYRHGLEVGLWRDYYPSGIQASEGEYVDGLEQGVWRFWDEEGAREESILYDRGKEVA